MVIDHDRDLRESTVTTASAVHRPAPTPVRERALAPDLARGMMLLLIALAHVPWFLFDSPIGPSPMHPDEGGVLDRIAQVVTMVVVDGRVHTMFAFLFAYGIVQMHRRQLDRGTDPKDARRLLRRRHWWMLAFGAVHALVLWQGDILGTYGVLGLILVPLFIGRRDRTVAIAAGVLVGLAVLPAILATAVGLLVPGAPVDNTVVQLQQGIAANPSYLEAAATRLPLWAFAITSGLFSLVLPAAFLLGMLAARHRVLERPAEHLRLLRTSAVLGIAIGWGTGLVHGLDHIGAIALATPAALTPINFATGLGTGLGYAALMGLVAHRLQRRGGETPLPARAVVSLGRRSLSGYLAQSVLFMPLLAAWGLGVGAQLSSASAMLVGLGTWLLTVVVAYALDRAGKRGPAEVALRRLTYGRG